jgi:hypothetical protein
LLLDSIDEEGDEDVCIDDDAAHVRCAHVSFVLRRPPSPRRPGRA